MPQTTQTFTNTARKAKLAKISEVKSSMPRNRPRSFDTVTNTVTNTVKDNSVTLDDTLTNQVALSSEISPLPKHMRDVDHVATQLKHIDSQRIFGETLANNLKLFESNHTDTYVF